MGLCSAVVLLKSGAAALSTCILLLSDGCRDLMAYVYSLKQLWTTDTRTMTRIHALINADCFTRNPTTKLNVLF